MDGSGDGEKRPGSIRAMTSVAVIGGGAVGCSIAEELACAGIEVQLLERDAIASGSTGLSVGVVESQYVDPLWIDLRVAARRIFDELEEAVGIGFVRCGYLRLALSQEDAAAFAASVGHQRELGVQDARVLDPEEISALAPALRVDDVVAGLWCPSDGYVDPHQAALAVAERARGAGADIATGCIVTGAERRDGRWHLTTSSGPYVSDIVVNAAGAWAGEVAALLGVTCDVVSQRRWAVQAHLARPLGYVHPFVMNYVPGQNRLGAYVRHEADDRLIAGLHSEEILDPPEPAVAGPGGVPQEALEEIASQIAQRLPALADGMALGEGWSGLYPCRPSGEPSIGWRTDTDGVIDAVGFGGSGVQSGPAAGILVRDWILHDAPITFPGADRLAPGAI
jgi:sarcosine oxidase subunit beta